MFASDRVFGVAVMVAAAAYLVAATGIQSSFLSDPVGPRAFPMMIGAGAMLCGAIMAFAPDPEPEWPGAGAFVSMGVAVAVLVAYAYALKPMGFLAPTAIAAAILSYQIHPRALGAALTGLALSVGLFVLFRYGLGLGLQPWPRGLF